MGGKTPSTHAANVLAGLSQQMFAQSQPARKKLFQQTAEALKTGGVGARIPIIQRAVEDVQAGTQQAMGRSREQLARSGLTGTPFAAQILAGQQQAGSMQAARIPTDIAQQLISGAPGIISSGSGIPGLASAASLQQSAANIGSQNVAAGYQGLGQGAGTITGDVLSAWLKGRGGGGTPTVQ